MEPPPSSSSSSRRDDCQSPFLVMSNIVHDYTRVVTTDETDDHAAFRSVECRSKEAYGCGETGALVVKGLTLFARAGPDEIGTLCIRASPDVFSCVGSEIDDEAAEVYGRQVRLSARVSAIAGHVMVLRVSFLAKHCYGDFRSYHLVYDSAAASLSMLPLRPAHCRPICTETPLIIHAGEDDQYSLVLMAQSSSIPGGAAEHTHPVMCLWSPPPPSADNNINLLDTNRCPWVLKGRSVPDNATDRFNASVSFSCKGNAVWGDLRQGILYCDFSALTDDTTDQPVDLKLVPLPSECRTRYFPYSLDRDIMPVDRNMGSVGDLVWFVAIEPSYRCPGDTVVKAWTLDLASSSEEWRLRKEFRMESVWGLPDDVFGAYGLPRTVAPVTVPEFLFFGRLDDDGCALYMMLPEPRGGGDGYAHLVCVDLSGSSEGLRVVSSRRLARPRLMDRPIVLDPDFLRHMSV